MNKTIFSLIFSGLLTVSIVDAKEIKKTHSHHLYFGPEWLNLKIDTHVKNVKIASNHSMAGFRLGYELIDPWAFYAGIDLLSTISSHRFHAWEHGKSVHSTDQPSGLANLDLRLGYTIGSRSSYSPYLGLGVYSVGSVVQNRGFLEGWLYVSTGLRSLIFVNDVFSMGINLQINKAVISYSQFKNHDVNVKEYPYPWGCEVGVPFIWSFNPGRTWTFDLEPYWTRLSFSENQQALGSKFLINAQF
jgi:hypothetical protein